ncbi:LuxR C-terminal-related transcriptional regulator [Actinomycetospora sp. TBRC 11914]|uniref:LuxR C-terminal-related transcriptional regulator n=1 Tax=Actinomycetospora sp. TBRC 11914 TaxID=2729387 RepID=UPI00145DAFDE|nr:LuxR C-terminal-related transcriptional regulator [Actinomycetospora sp. TBRC 11914]NMO93002.1 helix-turn-helix transcriptional regulator [Actinomycetospora sp. TBRC 11914]
MTADPVRPGPGPDAAAAARAAQDGDLDAALRGADAALQADDPREQDAGAVVLAAVLPQRGLLARAAEVHRWLAGRRGRPAAGAAVALLGSGALAEGQQAAACGGGLPGLRDTAETLTAQGLLASVEGSAGTALSLLVRATTALASAVERSPMGDSPAALGALLALHRGEPELADPLLDLAVDTDLGGPGLRRRHLLLRGWVALLRDDEDAARTALGAAADLPGAPEPRDELTGVALEVALARRAGDTRGLLDLWSRARQALLRHPVDLYCLLPVGELAVAAARLGETRWVEPHLAEADVLLEALGRPASWSTSWHWAGLHAAITAEDRAAAAAHAGALEAAVVLNDRAAAPARAARVWLAVLDGAVDAEEVAQAAAGLRAVGLGWDGTRLAGEAAIRTTDRAASTALLACARTLQAGRTPVAPVATAQAPAIPGPPDPTTEASARAAATVRARRAGAAALTERERDIADLVLEGLTYREIAGRLYLSAKTVEHHVSRIRRRVGAESRAELFQALGGLRPREH